MAVLADAFKLPQNSIVVDILPKTNKTKHTEFPAFGTKELPTKVVGRPHPGPPVGKLVLPLSLWEAPSPTLLHRFSFFLFFFLTVYLELIIDSRDVTEIVRSCPRAVQMSYITVHVIRSRKLTLAQTSA